MANKQIVMSMPDRTKEIEQIINIESKQSELNREVVKLVSMANKRLKRLEANDLTDLPAYQQFLTYNEPKFSVKGKSWSEVQTEYWRLKHFINSTTSTVRGANQVLKEMADSVGLQYSNLSDLKAKAPQFFRLADKLKEYLQTTGNTAEALDYKKIWEQINTYVQYADVDLGSVDDMEMLLDRMLNEYAVDEKLKQKLEEKINPLFDITIQVK